MLQEVYQLAPPGGRCDGGGGGGGGKPEEVAHKVAGGVGVHMLGQVGGVRFPGQGLVPQQHGHQLLIALSPIPQRLSAHQSAITRQPHA